MRNFKAKPRVEGAEAFDEDYVCVDRVISYRPAVESGAEGNFNIGKRILGISEIVSIVLSAIESLLFGLF